MAKGYLSNDEFFTSLCELFTAQRTKGHGSVYLTQKRVTYAADESLDANPPTNEQPFPDLYLAVPLPVIIRATNGKSKEKRDGKTKISTLVQPEALEAFYAKYAEVCKANMSGLKKRDRKGAKEKLRAKKKQGAGAVTEVKKS